MMLNNSITQLQIELWQGAPGLDPSTPTGPWTRVAGAGSLPSSVGFTINGTPSGVYGPLTGDHLLANTGNDVYFMLSEWFPVYAVGEWHFNVTGALNPLVLSPICSIY
jgi:hypothetical protein